MNEKLVIDATLAREIHNYISTTPTGNIAFDKVYSLLARLEQLPPLKETEKSTENQKVAQKPVMQKR